jgi:hypothetical protein
MCVDIRNRGYDSDTTPTTYETTDRLGHTKNLKLKLVK